MKSLLDFRGGFFVLVRTKSDSEIAPLGGDTYHPLSKVYWLPQLLRALRSCVVNSVLRIGIVIAAVLLSGCGGGGGDEEALPGKQATYSVGGTLILNGAPAAQPVSITVADSTANSGLTIALTAAGRFTFEKQLTAGTRFELDVSTSPGYGCQVRNGNRIMPGAAVNDIEVECTSSTFSLGGSVNGLGAVTGLRLSNGSDVLDVTGDGPFTFTPVPLGASYSVTLSSVGGFVYECNVANGSGSNVTADISNITVTCAMPIRATVSGLGAGTTGLTLNNGYSIPGGASASESVTATSNVTYTFGQRLPFGSTYSVAAVTSSSSDYTCAVTNGGGTIGAGPIDVAVSCQLVPTMTLASSTPVDDAFGVSRRAPLVLTFSVLLDASTVVPSSITLNSQYGPSAISLVTAGNRVTVTPTRPLRRGLTYVLSIAGTIRGSVNRERLASPIAIDFTTSTERIWHEPELIETDNVGAATTPRLATHANGDALAVWAQSDGARTNIWANRYSSANGQWGTAVLIETNNLGSALDPAITIDVAGNGYAVWRQFDGSRVSIWSNRYHAADNAWGTAILIETDNAGAAHSPQVTADAIGNALAIWPQSDGLRTNIWSNRYSGTSNEWGTATLIESLDTGDAESPQIGADAAGNAIALWHQYDGGLPSIWINRYTVTDQAWGNASTLEYDSFNSAVNPKLAMNAFGNAVALWTQADGVGGSIRFRRYFSSIDSWSAIGPVQDNAEIGSNPQVAMDADGNTIVVWQQSAGFNLWSRRFSVTSNSWSLPVRIEMNSAVMAGNARLATNSSGDAHVVWPQYDSGRVSIWSNSYTSSGDVWGTATLVEMNNIHDADSPDIVVAENGDALAVWCQTDGVRTNIWSSRFD